MIRSLHEKTPNLTTHYRHIILFIRPDGRTAVHHAVARGQTPWQAVREPIVETTNPLLGDNRFCRRTRLLPFRRVPNKKGNSFLHVRIAGNRHIQRSTKDPLPSTYRAVHHACSSNRR